MFKKISVGLTVALIMVLMLQTTALAAVLEVDTGNPMFKTDNWQKTADIDYNVSKALNDGAIADDNRFACIIQANQADIEGEPVVINGSATCSIVLPFKQTVNVESFNMKFINPTRQYFFLVHASMDGQNWTEVDISGGARKETIGVTFDADGSISGPAVTCNASTAAGEAADGDVNLVTFKLNAAAKANYFKITFYGNDGGQDVLDVTHAWISFNNLKFEGSLFVEETAAVAETPAEVVDVPVQAAPAPVSAAATVSTPKTGDASAFIFIIAGIVGLTGVVLVVSKRKSLVK